jgi:hypothetical protein
MDIYENTLRETQVQLPEKAELHDFAKDLGKTGD